MIALQSDWKLVDLIQAWEEWVALKDWLDAHGSQSVDFVDIVRQLNNIVNEQRLFSIRQTLQQRNALPRLDQGLIRPAEFSSVMFDGHNNGFIPCTGKKIVLIQGLKLRRDVQVGKYGRFIQLDDALIDATTQQPLSAGAAHLYSGFLTDDPIFSERKGLTALMAALRTFRYASDGDLKYCWTVGKYKSLTGREITLRAAGTVQYSEETALFESQAPKLTQVGNPGCLRLARHIEATLVGHQNNVIASELFNRAFLAPSYIQIPLLFSALEAIFDLSGSTTKKNKLGAFVAHVVGAQRNKAEFISEMYDLRNQIIHANEAQKKQIEIKIWNQRNYFELKKGKEHELRKLICMTFCQLMKTPWEPRSGTRRIQSEIFENRSDLRDLIQPKKKKPKTARGIG